MVTDDESVQERILRESLRLASEMDLSQPPPVMGQEIHRFVRRISGNSDPYRDVKRRFNHFALTLYPELKRRVEQSPDPFMTAVRLAIAGNVIDFGVSADVEPEEVNRSIAESLTQAIDEAAIDSLKEAINDATDILYLGDNAGEIVFDRLLIEQMPHNKVTFVVKGSPIINDATLEDACETGITELVSVIDNGSDAPGTILESCSEAFRRRFEKADIVIAKGQGNYETLSDMDKDIFFLLKAKCPVIARDIGCEVGSLIVLKKRRR